jgi:hypothetical protein
VSAKNDQHIGLTATVPATRDEVVAVIRHATGALSNKVDVSESSAKITMLFYPGLIKVMSKRSPQGAISLSPEGDDKVVVRARLEKWLTSQQRFMLIPVGPKRLVGKGQWVTYLRALDQEFRALGASIEHTGSW